MKWRQDGVRQRKKTPFYRGFYTSAQSLYDTEVKLSQKPVTAPPRHDSES